MAIVNRMERVLFILCLTSLWYLGFCGEFTHFPVCITIDQRSICGVYSTIAVNICRQLLRICQCVSSINRAIDDCCIRGIYDAISVHIPICHIRLRVCLCILKGEQRDGRGVLVSGGTQRDRLAAAVRVAQPSFDIVLLEFGRIDPVIFLKFLA